MTYGFVDLARMNKIIYNWFVYFDYDAVDQAMDKLEGLYEDLCKQKEEALPEEAIVQLELKKCIGELMARIKPKKKLEKPKDVLLLPDKDQVKIIELYHGYKKTKRWIYNHTSYTKY